MGMPLSELAPRMTAEEFGLHRELERREPLGPLTSALQVLLAALANGALQVPPGRKAWTAEDFQVNPWPLPTPAPAPRKAGAADVRAVGRAAGLPFIGG